MMKMGIFIIGMSFFYSFNLFAQALETVTVDWQTVPREQWVEGSVEAIKQATLTAQTSGQVTDVYFDVNDFVEKDKVIVRIRNIEQRASTAANEAQVREAQAYLRVAESEYERVRKIFEKQAISASAMDKATADLNAARARLQSATAVVARSSTQEAYTVVKAPYSGLVATRHIEVGEIAAIGQPLMTGFSLDELRVTTTVPQSWVNAVRQQQAARVFVGDERIIEGTKITIAPVADANSHAFVVRVDLPRNTQALFPNMAVKVAFKVGEEKALFVPVKAVAHRGELRGIYVLGDKDEILFRQVRLGQVLNGQIEVLAGLSAGEKIALNPVDAAIALKLQREKQAAKS